ncbi:MAG: sortase [Clostridiales bacterium]|nr:sortase [Candidatus Crickella caballi]
MKSRSFIRIGIFFLVLAVALAVFNVAQSNKAGRDAAKAYDLLSSVIQDAYAPDINPDREMPVEFIDGIDYIGIIEIERINVKLPVISEVSNSNLNIAPCRYKGSAYQDNLIIAAHNFWSHFGYINKLAPGDIVKFTDMEGNEFIYRVSYMETIKGTSVSLMDDGDWDLTLFTCTIGGVNRYTVRCEKEY